MMVQELGGSWPAAKFKAGSLHPDLEKGAGLGGHTRGGQPSESGIEGAVKRPPRGACEE